MIHSAREKVSPLMCSHVPPLKEKGSFFFLSCMEVCSIRCSIRGRQPYSLNGLQEHRLRGQCISSCYSASLQLRGRMRVDRGVVMLEVVF